MFSTRIRRTIIAASISLLPAVSYGANFAFQYNIKGNLLTQAFDDGRRTFLQAPGGVVVDSVYAIDSQNQKFLVPIKNLHPYIEIDGVYRRLEIVAGNQTAVVQYAGSESRNTSADAVPEALQQPSNSSYALVTDKSPRTFDSALRQPAAGEQSPQPVKMFGQASALNIDDDTHPTHANDTQVNDSIPFLRGKTQLGRSGRKAVEAMAKKADGRALQVVIYRDHGMSINQSKARGIALRKEFAKYGVTNIRWLDGGEAVAGKVMPEMRVAFVDASQLRPSASVVMPASSPTPAKATERAPTEPTKAAGAGEENILQSQIDAARSEYDRSLRRITDLVSQGLLNNDEFSSAKKRLEAKRDDIVRVAQESLNQIQARKAEAQAKLKQEAEARAAAAAAAVQSAQATGATATTDAPPLAIKATTVWAITEQDSSLRVLFQKWAKAANWELAWTAPNDFAISAKAHISGNLDYAINQVLASLQSAETPIVATFYEGNRVIKISPKDQI